MEKKSSARQFLTRFAPPLDPPPAIPITSPPSSYGLSQIPKWDRDGALRLPRLGQLNWKDGVRMNRQGAKDAKGQDLSRIHAVIAGSPLTKRTRRYFHTSSHGIAKRSPHREEILLPCRRIEGSVRGSHSDGCLVEFGRRCNSTAWFRLNLTLAHRRAGRADLGPPPLPIHACRFSTTARTEQCPPPVPQLPRTDIDIGDSMKTAFVK